MVISEIRSEIEVVEKNAALYDETNFDSRVEAVDYLEFNVIERIDGLLAATDPPAELTSLKQYAESVERRLMAIDDNLFRRLRADIRAGICTGAALKTRINKYAGRDPRRRSPQDHPGYDNLDVFVNGLLRINAVPEQTKESEPEMVYYQPTPARIIFELVEKAILETQDVFYDLGSGLGQVPILVNLLSGTRAMGVEFEPAYCEYARACAAELGLSRVEFINADARSVDYSDGTVFFMYTPFEGTLMDQVLEKLRAASRKRMIRLFTIGPCTPIVSRQSWLDSMEQSGDEIYKLAVFKSLKAGSDGD
jgi:precorrin-6B methylase 2